MTTEVRPLGQPLKGVVALPGDKSLSHRALIFAALASSPSELRHIGSGADNRATIGCLRQLGVKVEEIGEELVVTPPVRLSNPTAPLDCQNSGTTMRLLSGLLAGAGIEATLIGDDSLSSRPMRRVAEPLARFGAELTTTDGRAPLKVIAKQLHGSELGLTEPSAQVKTACILAALFADGPSQIHEPELTRDHSERLLAALGFPVKRLDDTTVRVEPIAGQRPPGFALWIPGDPSSAAFWSVLAAISPGSDLTIIDVSLNPTRLGFVDILRRMGIDITLQTRGDSAGEPWGDIRIRSTPGLWSTEVSGHEARLAIDELPVLAMAMACAKGTSRVRGAKDLRAKESDRIETTAALLRANDISVETVADGFDIVGGEPKRGTVKAHGDHRIALSASVLGLGRAGVDIDGYESASVSYGHFLQQARRMTAPGGERGQPVTVAIDGPAGAGKSTVSRLLAERLGYTLVDTGAIYRSVALAVLRAKVAPQDAEAVRPFAQALQVEFKTSARGQRVFAGGEDVTELIRSPEVSELASIVSSHRVVREALLDMQRRLAGHGGAILEGRDIGTVVFPAAQVKFFLDAAPEERARRRLDELASKDQTVAFETVLQDIRARDGRDSGRDVAPLRAAADAVHLDSTKMDIADVVSEMERRVLAKES